MICILQVRALERPKMSDQLSILMFANVSWLWFDYCHVRLLNLWLAHDNWWPLTNTVVHSWSNFGQKLVNLWFSQHQNACLSCTLIPVDIFGTVIGESLDCLLLFGTVVGENPDYVCWDIMYFNFPFELITSRPIGQETRAGSHSKTGSAHDN